MKLLTTVTIALGLVIPGASAAQNATTQKARPQGSDESSFTKAPDGDYKTTIRKADGSEQEFVVVPSTKVEPNLRADVSLRRTGDGFRTVYNYEVTNGPAARQEYQGAHSKAGLIRGISSCPRHSMCVWMRF